MWKQQLTHLLVLQLGLHLAQAVCLLGLITGDTAQEVEHVVVATMELVIGSLGSL